MTVRELINKLLGCNPDLNVVLQRNYSKGGEGYTHHHPIIQVEGHPGHSGPVIHFGSEMEEVLKAVSCKGLYPNDTIEVPE